MLFGDTIAAIATAPGRSGVAVIRVSGPDALAVAEKLTGVTRGARGTGETRGERETGETSGTGVTSGTRETGGAQGTSGTGVTSGTRETGEASETGETGGAQGTSGTGVTSGTRETGEARETSGASGTRGTGETRDVGVFKIHSPDSHVPHVPLVIDECVVLTFRAPHSYTGEDVVEFQCHGGTVTPRRVLEACFAAGARLARRGEFTQRALLNGKLDYEQAASVLDLIDAKTSRAADSALEGLSGRRRRMARALYEEALDLSVRIEHSLDIDEGELPEGFVEDIRDWIAALKAKIERAIRKSNEGKLLRKGALVVLAGPPNVGKSSLMNALLEERRAIVSDVPGTTRDSIEEWLDLDGWPVRLVDTAGLRSATPEQAVDPVEAEGIRRSEELISRADVVVWLDSATPSGDGSATSLRIHAKCDDLPSRARRDGPAASLRIHAKCDLARGEGLNVSARTGEGLEELKRAIVAKLAELVEARELGEASDGDSSALHEAVAGFAYLSADGPLDLVLAGNAVRQVAERLGAAIGAVYTTDMLDNLFSRFCVGK